MKLARTLISTACIAGLSLLAHSDEAPYALASAVIRADIVQTDMGVVASSLPMEATGVQTAPVVKPALMAHRLDESPELVAALTVSQTVAKPAFAAAPAAPIAAADSKPIDAGGVERAASAALADGVSTIGVLAAGGIETNPIMPVSPAGILMVTAAKMGMAKWADQLPEEERKSTLSSMSGAFGGAAVNNLLVLATAANPIALVGGLIAGVFFYNDTNDKLTAESEAKAAKYRAMAAEHHRVTMLAYNAQRAQADAQAQQQPLQPRFPVQSTLAANTPSQVELAQYLVAETADDARPVTKPVQVMAPQPRALEPVSTQKVSPIPGSPLI